MLMVSLLAAGVAATSPVAADPLPAPAPEGCRTVPVDADGPLGTAAARAAFGVDGTGVTVGVISGSFATDDSATTTPAEDVAAGVLPGPGNPCGRTRPVTVVHESPGIDDDEGRAMLQIVHGIAPGADLLFAAGPQGEAAFADVIRELADRGADVIVDDVGILGEPAYQAGVVEQAVAEVRDRGVVYLAAVGNYNSVGADGFPSAGRRTGSWETTAYRPADCPDVVATVLPGALDCLDFDPGAAADPTLTFGAGPGVTEAELQWAEPRFGVTQHFAVVVLEDGAVAGGQVMPDRTNPGITWAAVPSDPTATSDLSVVVVRLDSSTGPSLPRIRVLFERGGSEPRWLEYDRTTGGDVVGPTATGHNAGVGVLSVAAADHRTPSVPRPYSSHGPRVLLFGPVDGSTPAAPLPEPQYLGRPSVMAVDGLRTSFFGARGPDGFPVFSGTSAAAPAAAAVVALGRQIAPAATPDELATALTEGATPVESPWPDVSAADVAGAGLIDAVAFLELLAPPVTVPTPAPSPTPSPGTESAPTAEAPVAASSAVPGPPPPPPVGTSGTSVVVPVPQAPQLASTGPDGRSWPIMTLLGGVLIAAGSFVLVAQRRRTGRR
jgi:hypothetical protein